jgi:hypothetical protein
MTKITDALMFAWIKVEVFIWAKHQDMNALNEKLARKLEQFKKERDMKK